MKANHHHSQLRKSPRLSSSSSAQFPVQKRSKPESRAADNNALVLSLHVVDEPRPLKICHTFEQQEEECNNISRRSPRFTIEICKTPVQESRSSSKPKAKALSGFGSSHLRRSPRFSSPGLTLRSGKRVEMCGEVGPRKRCRSEGQELLAGRVLKKGRSLSLSRGENGNSDTQILALPEPGSGSLSKGNLSGKSLRSRTVLIHDGDKREKIEKCLRSRKIKFASVESSVNSEKRVMRSASTETFSVSGCALSEKCLRSRKIKFASVESSVNSEKRVVRSASSEKSSVNGSALSEKCLRSRKVIVQYEKEEKQKSASKKSSGDYALIKLPQALEKRDGGSSLRRSSRLKEDAGGSLKFEMLAFPQKCSVERKKKMQLGKQDERINTSNLEKSSSGVVSPSKCLATPKTHGDSCQEVQKDLERYEGEMVSEKCLRSRKVQFKVIVDETDEKKSARALGSASKNEKSGEKGTICCFLGDPVSEEEAHEKWGWRYELKSKRKGRSWKLNANEEDEIILNVDRHYAQARVGACVLNLGDCAIVKGEGKQKHVGRILEFFKTTEGEDYFRIQWFFRAEDTVLKDAASFHDKRRIFYSTLTNDNILDCIISKVNIVKRQPELCLKSNPIPSAAFYYDMEYSVEYSTFRTLITETSMEGNDTFLLNSKQPEDEAIDPTPLALPNLEPLKPELKLLDLYSGCGGMSTGLCIGAKLSGVNLMTKWAVDYDTSACESLKLNHPETEVRNEPAEDFLELLRQWQKLCKLYILDVERTLEYEFIESEGHRTQLDTEASAGEYEVSHLVDICYGDPNKKGKRGLHFKVRWKGYGPDDDTWEPIEGLANCQERIQDFVRKGFNSKVLPLPGDIDVICGGPPCQGISGYNRFRNFDSPLADERNRQIVVFMDIVEFLKPKYVLMENVVDIIRFDKGSLGRYALSRLVHMKYQARLGTMASGCYGLPQFRLRVFIWGAHPTETLPQFPLPTHEVVVKYWPPLEFERNIVAYDEGQSRKLEEAITLRDSISDLPEVPNNETREEMAYEKPPETGFQKYIRLSKKEITGVDSQTKPCVLFDHRPLQLSESDFLRVCQIPHRKGANFRDLEGVIVGEDNVVRLDPTKEPIMLPNGKPLVPGSVLSFEQGKSKRPYARLWWDETMSTVLTFPHVRSSAVLHPEQDRILTIRECARLQGFPDFYQFRGSIKHRYRQIGNAVSTPVARALGYTLGMAYQKVSGDEPLLVLPPNFSSQPLV